jgi:hypothetical protein
MGGAFQGVRRCDVTAWRDDTWAVAANLLNEGVGDTFVSAALRAFSARADAG